jgi:hypothetical protein
MENLQQVVVQLTTAPMVRALAQYGDDLIPTAQKEVIYSELSDEEKAVWNAFIEMILSK